MRKIITILSFLIVFAFQAKAESIDIFFNSMSLGSDYTFFFTDMSLGADLDVAITDNPSLSDYQIYLTDQYMTNALDVNIRNFSTGCKTIFFSNMSLGSTNIRISDSPSTANVVIYFAPQPNANTLNLHISGERINLQQAIAILYVIGLRNVR